MLELPDWLESRIETDLRCPSCLAKMDREFVTGVGIKESSKLGGAQVCWIEYQCLLCDKRSITEVQKYSMKDFVSDMFYKVMDKEECDINSCSCKGESTKKPKVLKITKRTKSKISDDEIALASKTIKDCNNWNDMMLGFGLDQSQIDSYFEMGKAIDSGKKVKNEKDK